MEIKINSVCLENSEKLYPTKIYVEMLVWKVRWVLNFKGLAHDYVKELDYIR